MQKEHRDATFKDALLKYFNITNIPSSHSNN